LHWFATDASPQPTAHVAPVGQVTVQPLVHLMSQFDPTSHETVLRAPSSSLQFALLLQVAVESAPAFSSHFEEPSQVMTL